MRASYVVHVVAGTLALLSGYVALYAAKGGTVHRRSGTAFVYTMLVMCVGGFVMAVGRGVAPAVNVPAALVTSYLVITALTTVRPAFAGSRPLHVALMLAILGVGLASLTFAAQALANGGTRKGMPSFPFFLFGTVSLLAFAGDVRVLRAGAPAGTVRVARHLWRMSFALFIAALSFFLGQGRAIVRVVPALAGVRPLFALPVLLVLVTMLYWMWRVLLRRSVRGLVYATRPRSPAGAPT
jgi:hypothetical protein